MTKTFSKKQKRFVKDKKKIQNVEGTQPTPTNNKSNHTEENKYSQPKLFNLPNTTLSKCQTSILLWGLKFTPTSQNNSIPLTCDLKTFAHKLRLTEYFDNHNVTLMDQKNESLVQGKSIFYPPRTRNKELETYISFINNRHCKWEMWQKEQFFTKRMDRVKKSDESARHCNQRSRQGRSSYNSKETSL